MSIYKQYIKEIQDRKVEGLNPKPIDDGKLLSEIIKQIKDVDHIQSVAYKSGVILTSKNFEGIIFKGINNDFNSDIFAVSSSSESSSKFSIKGLNILVFYWIFPVKSISKIQGKMRICLCRRLLTKLQ